MKSIIAPVNKGLPPPIHLAYTYLLHLPFPSTSSTSMNAQALILLLSSLAGSDLHVLPEFYSMKPTVPLLVVRGGYTLPEPHSSQLLGYKTFNPGRHGDSQHSFPIPVPETCLRNSSHLKHSPSS